MRYTTRVVCEEEVVRYFVLHDFRIFNLCVCVCVVLGFRTVTLLAT